MKLGVVTIGQSPRVDFTDDVLPFFSPEVELIQRGALDSFTHETIGSIAPVDGDHILVSRMRDGSQATFAEKHILPLMQIAIDELEEEGCSVILLLCTGKFPPFRHSSILIKPQEILPDLVANMVQGKKLGIIIPEKAQIAQMSEWWPIEPERFAAVSGSPYGKIEVVEAAARELKKENPDLIYLDCMGYTKEMKERVSAIIGKPVILPRTMIVRIINELLEGQGTA